MAFLIGGDLHCFMQQIFVANCRGTAWEGGLSTLYVHGENLERYLANCFSIIYSVCVWGKPSMFQ